MARGLLLLLALAAALQAQEEEPAFVVSGRVLDPGGDPVPGARVQAWDGERFLVQAESGEDGGFRVVLLPEDVARREHAYGPVTVRVEAEGMAAFRDEAAPGAADFVARLLPAREVRGVLLDALGAPVAGAVVSAGVAGSLGATTTGENGDFVLRGLPPGAVRLEASRGGAAAVGLFGESPGRVELRLPAAARVRCRVLGEEGRPVAGAVVSIAGGAPLAESDAQGVANLLLSGSVPLLVEADGHSIGEVSWEGAEALEVTLRRAPPLRGRVVDEDDGPLPACRVRMGEVPGARGTWTDETGRFEFRSPRAGACDLRVECAGFVPQAVRLGAGEGFVALRLHRGARAEAMVRADGKPALGASVGFLDGPRGLVLAVGYADPQGRAAVEGVPPEARWAVAERGGMRSAAVAVDAPADGRTLPLLLLELARELPVRGVLRSDAGPALAGVTCFLEGASSVTDGDGRFEFAAVPVGRAWRLTAKVPDHDDLDLPCHPGFPVEVVAASRFGRCRLDVRVPVPGAEVTIRRREEPRVSRSGTSFENLPPGVYDVAVRAPGYVEARRTVDLRDEATVEIGLDRGGTLRLAASPGAGVAVQTVQGRAAPVAFLELETGSRTLEGFGPGTYRFIARAKGELIVVREVGLGPNAPATDLDLRGGAASSLAIEVRDAAGAPVEGAEITLLTKGGFEWNTRRRTDATGRLLLERLIEGEIHVRAQKGNRLGEAALTVTPATDLSLTILLR